VFERADGSSPRVPPAPHIRIFQRALERHGVAFSLVSFFWRSKRKILAPKGEIFAKRCSRENKKQYEITKQQLNFTIKTKPSADQKRDSTPQDIFTSRSKLPSINRLIAENGE
jgi:hypothetical protein